MINARRKPATLFADDKGVSAVEFALVAPLMIMFYFGAAEFSNAMIADRKVTNVAAATADLIAQAEAVDDEDIADVFGAAASIMAPYSAVPLQIVVTSVIADAQGNPVVDWSDAFHASPRAEGSAAELPPGLFAGGGSVIMCEVVYAFQSPFGRYMAGGMTVRDRFFTKPRRAAVVERL